MGTKVLSVPSHRCLELWSVDYNFLTLPNELLFYKNSISYLQCAARLRIMFVYENVSSEKLCSTSRDTISICEPERDQWTTERAPHELLSLEAERIGGTEDRGKISTTAGEFIHGSARVPLINSLETENRRLPYVFVAVCGTSVTSNRRYVLISSR